jgi:hypothetical protein
VRTYPITQPLTRPLTGSLFGEAAAVGPTDPYWANVELLIKGGGAHGTNAIVDSSSRNCPIAVNGMTFTNATAKFGPTSIQSPGTSNVMVVTFVGTGGALTGDFTIEWWFHDTNGNGVRFMSDVGLRVYMDGTTFQDWNARFSPIQPIGTSPQTTWGHMAISRTGPTMNGWYNNTLVGARTFSGTIDFTPLFIGKYPPNNNLFWQGRFQELRVTKGVGRYPSACPIPTEPFPVG